MALEPVRLRWEWDTDDQCSATLASDCFLFKALIQYDEGVKAPWSWELRAVFPASPPHLGQSFFTGREPSVIKAQERVAAAVAGCILDGPPKQFPEIGEPYYDSSKIVPSPSLTQPQPPPTDSEHPAVWPLVFHDMLSRHAEGERKYGKPLRPHNGRDALTDAYQEALDLAVYLRQAIFERDER